MPKQNRRRNLQQRHRRRQYLRTLALVHDHRMRQLHRNFNAWIAAWRSGASVNQLRMMPASILPITGVSDHER